MALYDMSSGAIVKIEPTTFTAAKVLERTHLQAALRDNIALVGDDLLVVAEEFGEFADANRRIDLLCVDKSARLVVVELKRTTDGGHMDLQALRYAAMVSTMTFDELVSILARFRKLAPDDARSTLVDWIEDIDTDEPIIERDVGIVLVSQDFDIQITTTALWLNDVHGMDIRCVRLTPYMVDERLLLDVQQVIPLPEAEQFVVKLRRRDAIAKAAAASTKDYTKFIVSSAAGTTGPLNKRHAGLATIQALNAAGVPLSDLTGIMRGKLIVRAGLFDPTTIVDALRSTNAEIDISRFFVEQPIQSEGQTWVVSKMWGRSTGNLLEALVALAPAGTVSVTEAN